jgi:hypothetical protein
MEFYKRLILGHSHILPLKMSVQQFLTAGSLADNFWLPLSPQALDEVRSLQNDSAIILQEGDDSWSYPWGGNYTSSQYYQFYFQDINPHVSILWLWKAKCTPRVKFFGWLVLVYRLNTRNMLKRRQFQLSSGYQCLLCQNPPEETIEHLLFLCDFSKTCWQALGMHWADLDDRLQIIEDGMARWNGPLFMEIFLLASWNIWKERNKLYFEGTAPTLISWKERLKSDLNLLVHRTKDSVHSFIFSLIGRL